MKPASNPQCQAAPAKVLLSVTNAIATTGPNQPAPPRATIPAPRRAGTPRHLAFPGLHTQKAARDSSG
jgi:hypothetical protein